MNKLSDKSVFSELSSDEYSEMNALGDEWDRLYSKFRRLESEMEGIRPTKKLVKLDAEDSYSVDDEEYLGAVERGDMERAQEMVDEAARAKMPDTKIVDEDGKPLTVYHGTSESFTVFDMSKGRANMDIQGSFFSPWELDAQGYGENVGAYYLNITNPADESTAYRALNRYKGQNGAGVKAREYLISLGYDGVNNSDEEYIAFYPSQIKSADPVTYDDDGNVIPLSERFDESEEDIRYSVDEEDEYRTEGVHWLYETGEVSRGDVRFVWQTIANIGKRGYNSYARTYNGEYIADNGNKIFFINADYRSPYVSRLIVLADTYETNMARAKELIRNAYKRNRPEAEAAEQAVRDIYGDEYISIYSRRTYSKDAWEDGGREGTDSGRADSEDRVGRNPIDAYSTDEETDESGTADEDEEAGTAESAGAAGALTEEELTERARRRHEEAVRNRPRSEFEGTEALRRLGIQIEGSVGEYTGVSVLREEEKARREIERRIGRIERRLNPTNAEKLIARGWAEGTNRTIFLPVKS